MSRFGLRIRSIHYNFTIIYSSLLLIPNSLMYSTLDPQRTFQRKAIEDMQKPSIDTAHAKIAKTIRLAKKRMFRAHREGTPLDEARLAFLTEVETAIIQQAATLGARDVQATTIGHEPNRPPTYGHANPSREHNNLAAAVGEILTNEIAPPGLRNAVARYVTDDPPREPQQPNVDHVDDTDDSDESDPPIIGKRYVDALETLGLDMPTIDKIADAYLDSGDDSHLVLTIGLLQRLLTLENGKGTPESLDNYLDMLIRRLFRATHQCDDTAAEFATAAEARLPIAETAREKGGHA